MAKRGPKGAWKYKDGYFNKIDNVIDAFYAEYYRPPTTKELTALGVIPKKWPYKLLNCGYSEYLKMIGYDDCHGYITIEVLEDDEVIFTGTYYDVAEELAITDKNVKYHLRKNSYTSHGYKLRIKEFKGKLEGLV